MTRRSSNFPLVGLAIFLAFLFCTAAARAEVTLPNIFSDGMVLQRGESAPIYGGAAEGEKVAVTFRDKNAATVADKEGRWRVDIPPGEPGGPFVLTVKGTNDVTVKDVYVGDVWVASGQSNMHMIQNFTPLKEAPEAIRFFTGVAPYKTIKQHGIWQTRGYFSNFGQQFAAGLYPHVKVPIGMIYAAVGGSGIVRWMSEPVPAKTFRPGSTRPSPLAENDCYQQRIKPLIPYRIKGVIWWQGEHDSLDPGNYRYHANFPQMIKGWRAAWGQGDFPFLWVQLSSIKMSAVGYPRDAMRRALAIPGTGMAVSFDLTNGDLIPLNQKAIGSLHPSYCYPVAAERLVLAARAVAYGQKDLVWSGPLYQRAEIKGDTLVLHFTHTADGLVAKGDREPGDFEVQPNVPAGTLPGDAGEFQPVTAQLGPDKKSIVLNVKGLTSPFRVRYAWGPIPKGNVYNTADLPASPFVTDPIMAETKPQ